MALDKRKARAETVAGRRAAGVAAGMLVVALAAATLALLGGPSQGALAEDPVRASVTVVVGEGDTVWDLAGRHVPAGVDRAVYVAEVVAANDVDAGALVPGSVLRLPQR